VPLPGNKERLKDEIKRIKNSDKSTAAARQNMPEEERWQAELIDAFVALSTAFSGTSINQKDAISTIQRGQSNVMSVSNNSSEDVIVEIGRYKCNNRVLS
jgi:hypothetical protein